MTRTLPPSALFIGLCCVACADATPDPAEVGSSTTNGSDPKNDAGEIPVTTTAPTGSTPGSSASSTTTMDGSDPDGGPMSEGSGSTTVGEASTGDGSTGGAAPTSTGYIGVWNNWLPLTLEPGTNNFSIVVSAPDYSNGCEVTTIDGCRHIFCGPKSNYPPEISLGAVTLSGFLPPNDSFTLTFDDIEGSYSSPPRSNDSLWAGGEELTISADELDAPVVLSAPTPIVVTAPPLDNGLGALDVARDVPLALSWTFPQEIQDGSFVRASLATQQGTSFNITECDFPADAGSAVIGTEVLEELYANSPFSFVAVSQTVEDTRIIDQLELTIDASNYARTPSGEYFRPSITIVE